MDYRHRHWPGTHNEFVRILQIAAKEDDFPEIIDTLFTPSEIHDLALRWQIIKGVYKKRSQRALAAQLGVGVMKVSHWAKVLYPPKSAIRDLLEYVA